MASYINVTLDTTAPATPTISIDGGATYATDDLVDLTIGTADGVTTGYQMKIWGAVDVDNDPNVKDTELASSWITYATSKQIRISAGEGSKEISLKIRDDVFNESAEVSDTIIFDASIPQVTTTAPDVPRISKIATRNLVSFNFTSDTPFVEYIVKVVNSIGANKDLGTAIPTTFDSVNTSGTGTFDTSVTPIGVTIDGRDLEIANGGSGDNLIIKVFVRDDAGLWSA